MRAFLLCCAAFCFASCATSPNEYSGRDLDISKYQLHGSSPDFDTPPLLLSGRAPEYTLTARVKHQSGPVRIRCVVGTDGRAHDLRVEKAPSPGLAFSVFEAVKGWRWKPALKAGKPVPVSVPIQFTFLPPR